jgi:hypothetical protein
MQTNAQSPQSTLTAKHGVNENSNLLTVTSLVEFPYRTQVSGNNKIKGDLYTTVSPEIHEYMCVCVCVCVCMYSIKHTHIIYICVCLAL